MYGITNLLTRRTTEKDGTPKEQRRHGGGPEVFGAADMDDPVYRVASPVNYVNPMSPPVMTLHGRADSTVDHLQAEELASVLRKQGVPHELVLLDRIGHTFDFATWAKRPMPRSVEREVLAFLEKYNAVQ
jgi:dipeptidyl aminopeptidase/acylaminoacyl peptidase